MLRSTRYLLKIRYSNLVQYEHQYEHEYEHEHEHEHEHSISSSVVSIDRYRYRY